VARRRKPAEPKALRELVTAIYPSKEPDDVKAIRAFGFWDEAVPERVANNARPVALIRGTLVVHASTTVWAQEIDLLAPQLLQSLRKVAPRNGIRRLKVKVGRLPPPPPRPRPAPPPPAAVPVAALPEDLARELGRVGDDDVRDAIGKAASMALGREELERRQKGG
jgi:hypothetical protein